jgi:multidrug efflux pump subunit AcrB
MVPMAVAGALFSLWLFNQTWNIFSVKLGTSQCLLLDLLHEEWYFLIVEFANQFENKGKPKLRAIWKLQKRN